MTDKEQITRLYKEMYRAMVNKDRAELERVHDDSFVLVHMTGIEASLHRFDSYISKLKGLVLTVHNGFIMGDDLAV